MNDFDIILKTDAAARAAFASGWGASLNWEAMDRFSSSLAGPSDPFADGAEYKNSIVCSNNYSFIRHFFVQIKYVHARVFVPLAC